MPRKAHLSFTQSRLVCWKERKAQRSKWKCVLLRNRKDLSDERCCTALIYLIRLQRKYTLKAISWYHCLHHHHHSCRHRDHHSCRHHHQHHNHHQTKVVTMGQQWTWQSWMKAECKNFLNLQNQFQSFFKNHVFYLDGYAWRSSLSCWWSLIM